MMKIPAKYRIPCLVSFLMFFFVSGCAEDRPSRPLYPATTFSLSGAVTASAPSVVDSDTNNPVHPLISNDSADSAQQLEPLVSLGGYVTAAPTGVSGDRFATSADEQDWYRLTLSAGQTVSLRIADHDGDPTKLDNPDLDLFLFDPQLTLVQTSESKAQTEMIQVQTTGDYFLQVKAISGKSIYRLTTGPTQMTTLPAAARIEQDFVPGELIVRLRPQVSTAAAGQHPVSLAQRAEELGLRLRAGGEGAAALYELPSVQPATATPHAAAHTAVDLLEAKRATLDALKRLQQHPDVLSADLNYLRRPLLVPNDPLYASQWNLDQIHLPEAWDFAAQTSNAVIAVVDTGVLFDHPDLAGRLCVLGDDCAGYDFVSNSAISDDGDGIDPDPQDPGDKSLPGGASFFHGTHVAGIIGAAANNNEGIAGVDWQSKIMPIRVFGRNVATSYDIMQGLRYAAGLDNDALIRPQKAANVINLSLGGGGFSTAEQALFSQLHAAGIFVVAAAGNETSTEPVYPAAYAGVLSVSAVDFNKERAWYSNYGATIDLAAPGGDTRNAPPSDDGVLSTSGNDLTSPITYDYVAYQGTSMATPHVSGVIGLMLAADPALTPADFDALLARGALTEDLGNDGATTRNDDFGYGLIDANKALLAAFDLAGNPILPPVGLDIGPQTLALVDAQSGAVRYRLQVSFDPASATYPYSFPAVEAGSYLLLASSDLDNDGQLCDAGEACGRYPWTGNPVALEVVEQNLDTLDFSSAFE